MTVSTAEQLTAAGIGLLTAGPMGAVSAWGMIRFLNGKWTPWALLGVVVAPAQVLLQVVILTAALSALPPAPDTTPAPTPAQSERSW